MNDGKSGPLVLCFGEILWDFLPAGLFAGGAPFNVGYHLHQHGCDVGVVSAVGRDVLGGEILRRLRHWGLSTAHISELESIPTGYVQAEIGKGGDARYTITENVAWDHISLSDESINLASRARAVVFGSLAQRSESNRSSLTRLLDALPPTALRIFDVNLRPPYDDLELVRSISTRATLIKLNNDEAARLAESQEPEAEEANARKISEMSAGQTVCVTSGAHGAGLLCGDDWIWESSQPVQVADTVGAGDSFLAALTNGLLRERQPKAQILSAACRLGEWVASQRGATPDYDETTPLSAS